MHIATVSPPASRQPRHQLKGRQPTPGALGEVRALFGAAPLDGHDRSLLIEHLHAVNDRFNGLPRDLLVALAHEMRLSTVEVMEVATFYHHFEVLPDGVARGPDLTVRVCDGLSCRMAGALPLLEQLQASLGEHGADGRPRVRVQAAPCVGRCEQAPAVQVGQWPVAQAKPDAVRQRVQRVLDSGLHKEKQAPALVNEALNAANFVGFSACLGQGGYAHAQAVAAGTLAHEQVLHTLEHAGLRGLGGAGFPAGRKWRIVQGNAARLGAQPLLAVNIDEGEPGTFKDRWCLERDPHRFLEGLLVAMQVVGCEAAYLYLRDEYPVQRAVLEQALDDLHDHLRHHRENPLQSQRHGAKWAELAEFVLTPVQAPGLSGRWPRIELRRGAGAYICGEESAMIESIEGKRGEPRLRPPYIAEVGLFGRPTLEHNFETLFWVPELLEKGGDWFAAKGRHGRKGLRRFSVSGRVKEPGVKLAPAGITLRELIDEHCGGMAEGHTLYGYLPGGASGGIFPASLADVPLDFDTLQPHGGFIGSAAVIVLGEADRARDAALAMMDFFAHESCGQCTPCRVGTHQAAGLMHAHTWDADTLNDLSAVMQDASICGLGQAAPNPVQTVLRYFPREVGHLPGNPMPADGGAA